MAAVLSKLERQTSVVRKPPIVAALPWRRGITTRKDPARAKGSVSAALEESFEEVVDRYYEKVFNLAFRYMGDTDEACELTQEVFVKAYQSFGRFRGDSAVYTWLYRITTNLCFNRIKQLRRYAHLVGESLDEAPGGDEESEGREIPDRSHSPEDLIASKEMHLWVRRCVQALPPDYRTVVVLRDMEGLSYQEIAEITSCTLEAVKSRLFRARMALRDLLRPYLYPQEQPKD